MGVKWFAIVSEMSFIKLSLKPGRNWLLIVVATSIHANKLLDRVFKSMNKMIMMLVGIKLIYVVYVTVVLHTPC